MTVDKVGEHIILKRVLLSIAMEHNDFEVGKELYMKVTREYVGYAANQSLDMENMYRPREDLQCLSEQICRIFESLVFVRTPAAVNTHG